MADRIYALTGNSVSTSWTLPHFLWVRETEPELWKTVRHICFSKDSILHWLTGKWVTDPATAVASLLFDINLMSWSAELCSVLGIPPDSMRGMLPCVRAADTCAGSILPQIAAEFGLPAAVSVLTGTLDSATETYGAGASKPGDVVIRIGTAGGIHKLSAVPIENRKLLTYPFPKGNIWYSQAGTNAAGAAVGWAVGLVSEKSGPAFDNFDKAAGSVPPGSENLFFLPFLSGERTPYWNPDLRGTFLGLSFHHTKAHMARAVLEGVAYSLTDALQTIISDGELPETVTVVGGGTKDGLLMKILSSILNRRLSVLPDVDSAYGTALLCLGDVPLQCQSHTTVIEPDQKWSCFYRNGFTKYKKNCMLIANVYS
jgi:xylulokinase